MNKLNLSKECEQFFDQFVKELSVYSDEFNMPFITSSLYQILCKRTYESVDFIYDIKNYRVDIDIEDTNDDYKLAVVRLYLYNKQNDMQKDYYYRMSFILDTRYNNYCQCTPDMEGYREDKGCCGYDCDATFCTCQIDMIKSISYHRWDGCEHDYWDYEDSFYETYPELNKTQRLLDDLRNAQRELAFAKEKLEKYRKQLIQLESVHKEYYEAFGEMLKCEEI